MNVFPFLTKKDRLSIFFVFTVLIIFAGILMLMIVVVGFTNEAMAQSNPNTLLFVAERARDHIGEHIAPFPPETMHELFEQGVFHIVLLENAVAVNDADLAEMHFLSAMKIFKSISEYLHQHEKYGGLYIIENDTATITTDYSTPQDDKIFYNNDSENNNSFNQTQDSINTTTQHPQSEIARLTVYTNTLKTVTESIEAPTDFNSIDVLFEQAQHFVETEQFVKATDTILLIKEHIIQIDSELREHASEQVYQHAKEHAMTHLNRIDYLVEQAVILKIPSDVVTDLKKARESLAVADTPKQILQEIKIIMEILEKDKK